MNAISEKSNRELRLIVTPKCNYRCIFCHNEGIDKEKDFSDLADYQILNKIISNRYKDITFTGGEPLLSRKIIYNLIDSINDNFKEDYLPEITVVSNGSLIDTDFIKKIKKYPKFKIHISLHAADEKTYRQIINVDNKNYSMANVIKNLKLLTKNGIKTKINYVVLRNLNNSEAQIDKIINLSIKLNVNALKFIELLIPNNKEYLCDYYYESGAIEMVLPESFKCVETNGRKKIFKAANSDLLVEIEKCTCKFGCLQCNKYRPVTITSSGFYYPCFVSDSSMPINVNSFKDILKRGELVIKKMGQRYQNNSPILNNEPIMVKESDAIFFQLNSETFEKIKFFKNGIEETRRENITDSIYFPSYYISSEWENFEKVLKVKEYSKSKESKFFLVLNKSLNYKTLYIQKSIFLNDKDFIIKGKPDYISKVLKELDFKKKHSLKLNISYYFTTINNKRINFSLSKLFYKKKNFYFIMFKCDALKTTDADKDIHDEILSFLSDYDVPAKNNLKTNIYRMIFN